MAAAIQDPASLSTVDELVLDHKVIDLADLEKLVHPGFQQAIQLLKDRKFITAVTTPTYYDEQAVTQFYHSAKISSKERKLTIKINGERKNITEAVIGAALGFDEGGVTISTDHNDTDQLWEMFCPNAPRANQITRSRLQPRDFLLSWIIGHIFQHKKGGDSVCSFEVPRLIKVMLENEKVGWSEMIFDKLVDSLNKAPKDGIFRYGRFVTAIMELISNTITPEERQTPADTITKDCVSKYMKKLKEDEAKARAEAKKAQAKVARMEEKTKKKSILDTPEGDEEPEEEEQAKESSSSSTESDAGKFVVARSPPKRKRTGIILRDAKKPKPFQPTAPNKSKTSKLISSVIKKPAPQQQQQQAPQTKQQAPPAAQQKTASQAPSTARVNDDPEPAEQGNDDFNIIIADLEETQQEAQPATASTVSPADPLAGEVEKLRQENIALMAKVTELEARIRHIKATSAQQTKGSSSTSQAAEMTKLQDELNVLRAGNKSLLDQQEMLKKKYQAVHKELDEETEKWKKGIQEKDERITLLISKADSLQEQLSSAQAELNKEKEQRQKDAEASQAQVTQQVSSIQLELTQEKEARQKDVEAYKAQAVQLENDYNGLAESYKKAQAEVTGLQEGLHAREAQIAELTNMLKQKEVEMENTLKAHQAELTRRFGPRADTITSSSAEPQAASELPSSQELVSELSKIESLRKDFDALSPEAASTSFRLAHIEAILAQLMARLPPQ